MLVLKVILSGWIVGWTGDLGLFHSNKALIWAQHRNHGKNNNKVMLKQNCDNGYILDFFVISNITKNDRFNSANFNFWYHPSAEMNECCVSIIHTYRMIVRALLTN